MCRLSHCLWRSAEGSIPFWSVPLVCLLALTWAAGLSQTRAAELDDSWDDRFAWALLEGPQVRAVASRGSDVYFGGHFTTVGGSSGVGSGVSATNIAMWNGRHWSALGGGVNGQVHAIAFQGNDVYVGGEFTEAGGVNATNIARWDGTNWWPVGGGLNDTVYTLVFRGAALYAGGRFTTADGNNASRIALWDGANWSEVGGGLGNAGSVRSIAFVGSDMYACGDFNILGAGQTTIRAIARFDGNSWQALAGDLGTFSDTAYAMVAIGNDLYVGGTFLTAGGMPAKRVARWNGAWSPVGAGITASAVGVYAMTTDGTNLYVAGQINAAGGITTGNTAKWDGTNWSGLGIGIPGATVVNGLTLANGDLYVGGAFLGIGAGVLHTYSTARWDGTDWWALGQGMDNAVFALAGDGTNTYAGGWFYRAGGVDAGNLARWDGNRWSSLGNANFGSEVLAIASSGTNVYAGGSFPGGLTNGFGFSAFGIARWNGAAWSGLGAGVRLNGTNGVVRAIAVASNGTVYAGGTFTQAGGAAATNIAKFFTNWQAVGISPNSGVNGEVRALATSGNDLYVGGAFTQAGGVDASGIAKWDGSSWSAVGTGLTGAVMTLVFDGADLYAGGKFIIPQAGATNIAKWNGNAWSPLGAGIGSDSEGSVEAIAVNGNEIYAGGNFTNAGGIVASNVARWAGGAWSALGSGVAPGKILNPAVVRALAFTGGGLLAGGSFASAGGKPSYGFAIWHPPGANQPQASLSILAGGSFVISWTSVPETSYQIRSTTNLSEPFSILTGPIPSSGGTTQYTNAPSAEGARFFQVEQLPP